MLFLALTENASVSTTPKVPSGFVKLTRKTDVAPHGLPNKQKFI